MNLKHLEKIINKACSCPEEKEELTKIVEEIVHHRVLGCVLENLDQKDHEKFLKDIAHYKFSPTLEKKVTKTIKELEKEILQEIS